jgi:integrase
MIRTGWTEVDLVRAEWRILPERMKLRRPHIVPMSRQAVELLKELRQITGNSPRLFPSEREPEKCMGSSTIGAVFVRAGVLPGNSRRMASDLRPRPCYARRVSIRP